MSDICENCDGAGEIACNAPGCREGWCDPGVCGRCGGEGRLPCPICDGTGALVLKTEIPPTDTVCEMIATILMGIHSNPTAALVRHHYAVKWDADHGCLLRDARGKVYRVRLEELPEGHPAVEGFNVV